MKKLIRIAVTGGAGQIAYSLLFRLAHGDLFGPEQPIALHLLDLPVAEKMLGGVKMELDDCAFPLLKEVKIGTDAEDVFGGVQYAFLVGAKPRGPGMERKDLLADNGKIFVGQGKALSRAADKNVRVLVVGNPCNTNCLIAMHNAPDLKPNQFFAMTMLDQNRAQYQLAARANVDTEKVSNVTIWGNHSATQVPDFVNAKIEGNPVEKVIGERSWLEGEFSTLIQKRGAAVIGARGKSSAASAANAAVDAMKAITKPTMKEDWFSMAIFSKGNPYGINEDLIFSFPCRSDGNSEIQIMKGLEIDSYLKEKIDLTQKELVEERDLVRELLP